MLIQLITFLCAPWDTLQSLWAELWGQSHQPGQVQLILGKERCPQLSWLCTEMLAELYRALRYRGFQQPRGSLDSLHLFQRSGCFCSSAVQQVAVVDALLVLPLALHLSFSIPRLQFAIQFSPGRHSWDRDPERKTLQWAWTGDRDIGTAALCGGHTVETLLLP